ncbi:MAG: hypothetical protein WCF36_16250 [Candidatus Nanopelagicales bacterium]
MSLLETPPDPGDPARLRLESTRTCDRLRSMSAVRLAAGRVDGRSRARAAFDLAQEFADHAAELAGGPQRRLPELGDFAAADVLAVCALDLVAELDARGGLGAPESAAACESAVTRLIELRRSL